MSVSQDSRDHGPDGMEPRDVIESNWNEVVDSSDDMNLSESLLHGMYVYTILPCIKDTEGGHDTRRLHGCLLSRLYWGHQRVC
uniref:Uncharacterized protein n=1 Tax=Nomascus leucogenys TaxID=61853 RepID=A0A2I3HEB9_NOMLE